MRQLCSAALTLMFIVMPVSANAVSSEGRDLIVPFVTPDTGVIDTESKRDEMVTRVRKYCEFVDREFPRNSPAEEHWLDQETEAGTDRFFRAVASPEWGRRMTDYFVKECFAFSDAYKLSATSAQKEWALIMLAHTFVKRKDDLEDALKSNGIDDEKFGFFVLDSIAQKVLEMAALEVSGEQDPNMMPRMPGERRE